MSLENKVDRADRYALKLFTFVIHPPTYETKKDVRLKKCFLLRGSLELL